MVSSSIYFPENVNLISIYNWILFFHVQEQHFLYLTVMRFGPFLSYYAAIQIYARVRQTQDWEPLVYTQEQQGHVVVKILVFWETSVQPFNGSSSLY